LGTASPKLELLHSCVPKLELGNKKQKICTHRISVCFGKKPSGPERGPKTSRLYDRFEESFQQYFLVCRPRFSEYPEGADVKEGRSGCVVGQG
jgi:hypothetical protein